MVYTCMWPKTVQYAVLCRCAILLYYCAAFITPVCMRSEGYSSCPVCLSVCLPVCLLFLLRTVYASLIYIAVNLIHRKYNYTCKRRVLQFCKDDQALIDVNDYFWTDSPTQSCICSIIDFRCDLIKYLWTRVAI